MKFRICGADMYSGQDVDVTVEAGSRHAAGKIAQQRSIIVLSIEPADEADTGPVVAVQRHKQPAPLPPPRSRRVGRVGRLWRRTVFGLLCLIAVALTAGLIAHRQGVAVDRWVLEMLDAAADQGRRLINRLLGA